ncbi:hypothetical protein P8452_08212 [Trifolium repens]|nr:hypothetical protein P8452_08212 [Trifolium repens]
MPYNRVGFSLSLLAVSISRQSLTVSLNPDVDFGASELWTEDVLYFVESSSTVRSASKTLQPLVSQKQSLLKIPSLLQHRSGAMTYQFRMFSTVFEDIDPENLKAEVDFRRSGTMTSIDHQGGCGSCWAYATVSAVESVKQLKTGILEKLSSQELIDCLEGFQGCEKETTLKNAVMHQPVIATIFVGEEFDHYRAGDGIFQTEASSGENHAVLVIGYGLIERGVEFFGRCGIAFICYYPVWEEQADASQDSNSDIVAKTPPPKSGVISPSTSVLPDSTFVASFCYKGRCICLSSSNSQR